MRYRLKKSNEEKSLCWERKTVLLRNIGVTNTDDRIAWQKGDWIAASSYCKRARNVLNGGNEKKQVGPNNLLIAEQDSASTHHLNRHTRPQSSPKFSPSLLPLFDGKALATIFLTPSSSSGVRSLMTGAMGSTSAVCISRAIVRLAMIGVEKRAAMTGHQWTQ